jgi:hypothetical protein
MAHDQANRDTFVPVVDTLNSSPPTLFSLAGLIVTAVRILLLSVGLFRGHVGPRWIAPLLWTFLVLELVGSAVSGHASLASTALGAVALLALARVAHHSPAALWTSSHDEPAVLPTPPVAA